MLFNQKSRFILFIVLGALWLFAQELDYVPGEMLLQFKNECRGLINLTQENGIELFGIKAIDELNRQWKVLKIKKVILDPTPDTIAMRMGLDLLYHLTFPKETDIEKIIEVYKASPYVKYACPNVIYQVTRIPNDPRYPEQWHLPNIGCPQAWDASTGDTAVVTAIVDMGIDYNHEDVQANLWINPEEDINHNGRFDPEDLNGFDDDNNGYVDDVIGYDFLNGDPDPMPDTPADDHGMHCFGIATAVTNNSTGVAGIGWGIRGMALKCGNNSGIYLYPAIAAIYYAADNGAWVISMSYGSYRGQNEAESTALAYAWERGLVEVAGAGNDNVQTPHYPSAYSWVIAVAASNASNVKADFSNYGTWIDICAPGVHILSTITSNNYAFYDGTSMATPVVAGVCALVKSAFPTMTNAECTTRIFSSCDSMPDPLYRSGLLGYGRVNVAKAVLQPIRSNLSITDFRFNDQSGNNNGIPEPGEEVALIITLANEIGWQPANAITAIINNDDPEIEILKNYGSFPNIPPGGSGNCSADSFILRISDSAPPYRARFNLTLTCNPPTLNPFQQLFCVIGRPRVLLVDDDDGDNIERWYQCACDSLGVIYRLWSVSGLGSPLLDTLNHYPVVIWFTGLDSTQTLTNTDMTNLSSYLDNGGNLFLCGQNLGQEIGAEPFYHDYLHCRYLSNRIQTGSIPKVVGIDEDPIGYSSTDTLVLLGVGGANNARSMDGIQPIGGAVGSHHYVQNPDTIYAGIHFAGDYKVVYFGFPFEAIDAATRYTQKKEILRRILVFFNERLPKIAEEFPLSSFRIPNLTCRPNPFSTHTIIYFSPKTQNQIRLRRTVNIYNRSGRLVTSYKLSTTSNCLIWDGTDFSGRQVPQGIYFCVIQNGDLISEITKLIRVK